MTGWFGKRGLQSTIVTCSPLSAGQLSGNGLITYFLPILLQNAGIKSQNRRLTLNFVNSVTS